MADFPVTLCDPTELNSSESEGEHSGDSAQFKQSPETVRLANVLRTSSECGWNTRCLILIRGLPGCGKTSLAKFIVKYVPNHVVVSEADCEQELQRSSLTTMPITRSQLVEEARAACKQKAWSALQSNVPVVVVDNENLQAVDMEPYVVQAVKRDYTIHLIEPNTRWRYKPARLIQLTHRPVTLADIQRMNTLFDRSITSDDLIREANKKLNPLLLPSREFRVDGTAQSGTEVPESRDSKCEKEPPTPSDGKARESLVEEDEAWNTADDTPSRLMQKGSSTDGHGTSNYGQVEVTEDVQTASTIEPCAPSTSYPEPDPLDHLATVFPHIRRDHIREFLDLAAGDIEWASSLILEGVQIGSSVQPLRNDETSVSNSSTAQPSPPIPKAAVRLTGTQLPQPSTFESVQNNSVQPQIPTTIDLSTTTQSVTEVSENSKGFSVTRQFIQDAHQLYGYALGVPSVDLSVAAVPDFLFDEWHPEPELVRGILQSFLRFLGVAQTPLKGENRSRANHSGGSPKNNRTNRRQRLKNRGNQNYVTESTSFVEIMNDDEVIHRSVQDFRSSLDAPVVRRIIDRLMEKFPNVQRATVEEAFVKSDFKESDTENQLRLLFPCSHASGTENESNANPSTINTTEQSGSVGAPGSTEDTLPLESGLSLQEIQDEEEALRRSVEDQRSKLQSLASQLSLCRLKSRFPDIQLIELENLLIRFDLNEPNVVKHLVDRGFFHRPVAPLIPATETPSSTPSTETEPSGQFPIDLDALEAQLSVVRQRICHMRQIMYGRPERGAGRYYSSELGRLYREQRELTLLRAQCLIDARSTTFERELLANGDGPSIAAFKAFAYIDLHGLEKTCALAVLKQRMQWLEARLQQPDCSSSNICAIVITGRGGGVESDVVRTSPILRPAVMNYLTANRYKFCEKYAPGSGYLTVTVQGRR